MILNPLIRLFKRPQLVMAKDIPQEIVTPEPEPVAQEQPAQVERWEEMKVDGKWEPLEDDDWELVL